MVNKQLTFRVSGKDSDERAGHETTTTHNFTKQNNNKTKPKALSSSWAAQVWVYRMSSSALLRELLRELLISRVLPTMIPPHARGSHLIPQINAATCDSLPHAACMAQSLVSHILYLETSLPQCYIIISENICYVHFYQCPKLRVHPAPGAHIFTAGCTIFGGVHPVCARFLSCLL